MYTLYTLYTYVYPEPDRLLLLIPVNQKIMKYFVYLNSKDNDSIVKQSLI